MNRRTILITIFMLMIGASAIGMIMWIVSQRVVRSGKTYSDAKRAFQQGDHATALSICNELLEKQSDAPNLLLIAGESCSKLKQYEQAISFYDRVLDSARSDAATARWAAGEVTLQMKQMSATIQKMERALALDSGNDKARDRLIYLLNLSGRRWDAFPHLFELVKQNRWSVQHLLYLGNIAMPVENEKELKEFLVATPQDRLPLLGLASIRLREGATAEAKRLLTELMEQSSELVEAHVQLGKLLQQVDPDELPSWNRSLPVGADTHPVIWFIRGEWARDHGQPESAARCFAESIRLDPDHLAALNAMTQMLAIIGQPEHVQSISKRATKLEKLAFVFERIMSNEWSGRQSVAQNRISQSEFEQYLRSKGRLEPILLAAQQTLDLGRIWESMAWSRYGLSFDPSHLELRRVAELARPMIDRRSPRTRLEEKVVDAQWIQSLKLPVWTPEYSQPKSMANSSGNQAVAVKFTETDGLNFTYYASRTSFEDGRRMFEITGGGVGILDYDRDGWPDVYLAQGSNWPPDDSDRSHSDRLKRNRSASETNNSVFEDVTQLAGVEEHAFGQGVAIGDVDSDGFDDVYVCNFGINQLWMNQGDGTFRDGSARIDSKSASWTVSAAIADLNGDGLVEIYDANYVEGEDVESRRCLYKGMPRACSPLNFRQSPGRLLKVDDKGVFHDIGSQVLAPSIKEGNALGVVVVRLKDHPFPSIFVANDQVANLMLTAEIDTNSPLGIRYEDNAILNGLAYDGEGKAQACMGVATGDVNQDGAIDLFVTNYYDETNTLYLQESSGVFRDSTRASGMVAPSLKMLGFGTQFLDAQSDGVADLIVLNGHIDDMSHAGIPFRMRAQYFAGDSSSRFLEKRSDAVGGFFEIERLGRALALIDFNRDGKQDFVATDLEKPASLVRNDSEAGNYLSISFVGIQSHRDAIGTEVVATVADKKWTKQLVGGCGYMVTNQRVIHFGLGSATKVDRIEIVWPSGVRQTYTDLQANSHWIAIENQSLHKLL